VFLKVRIFIPIASHVGYSKQKSADLDLYAWHLHVQPTVFGHVQAHSLIISFIRSFIHSFIHSFIETISIAPLRVHYYSDALPTEHGHCAGVSRRSATGNCEWLSQGPYLAARAGFKSTTFRLKGIDSTNVPSRPMRSSISWCSRFAVN